MCLYNSYVNIPGTGDTNIPGTGDTDIPGTGDTDSSLS